MRLFLALPLIAALAACGSDRPPPPRRGFGPPPPAGAPEAAPRGGFARGGRVFISPMGEPFRAEQPDEDQIGRWFAGADADHDGVLTVAEMQADAARFFATLDANHDGEIDPAEIERYETEIAPEIHQLGAVGGGLGGGYRGSGMHGGHGGHGGGMGGGGMAGRGMREGGGRGFGAFGAGRATSLLDLPEPVTAADANFNRGVSLQEFREAAAQRFLLLDANHDGRLERGELVPFRPQRPASPAANMPHPEND